MSTMRVMFAPISCCISSPVVHVIILWLSGSLSGQISFCLQESGMWQKERNSEEISCFRMSSSLYLHEGAETLISASSIFLHIWWLCLIRQACRQRLPSICVSLYGSNCRTICLVALAWVKMINLPHRCSRPSCCFYTSSVLSDADMCESCQSAGSPSADRKHWTGVCLWFLLSDLHTPQFNTQSLKKSEGNSVTYCVLVSLDLQ